MQNLPRMPSCCPYVWFNVGRGVAASIWRSFDYTSTRVGIYLGTTQRCTRFFFLVHVECSNAGPSVGKLGALLTWCKSPKSDRSLGMLESLIGVCLAYQYHPNARYPDTAACDATPQGRMSSTLGIPKHRRDESTKHGLCGGISEPASTNYYFRQIAAKRGSHDMNLIPHARSWMRRIVCRTGAFSFM